MTAQFDTVTIVGVGLLGGSLGLALKERAIARRVIGVGRRRDLVFEHRLAPAAFAAGALHGDLRVTLGHVVLRVVTQRLGFRISVAGRRVDALPLERDDGQALNLLALCAAILVVVAVLSLAASGALLALGQGAGYAWLAPAVVEAGKSRAATTARWRIHDDLVRGNPTRIERP